MKEEAKQEGKKTKKPIEYIAALTIINFFLCLLEIKPADSCIVSNIGIKSLLNSSRSFSLYTKNKQNQVLRVINNDDKICNLLFRKKCVKVIKIHKENHILRKIKISIQRKTNMYSDIIYSQGQYKM